MRFPRIHAHDVSVSENRRSAEGSPLLQRLGDPACRTAYLDARPPAAAEDVYRRGFSRVDRAGSLVDGVQLRRRIDGMRIAEPRYAQANGVRAHNVVPRAGERPMKLTLEAGQLSPNAELPLEVQSISPAGLAVLTSARAPSSLDGGALGDGSQGGETLTFVLETAGRSLTLHARLVWLEVSDESAAGRRLELIVDTVDQPGRCVADRGGVR